MSVASQIINLFILALPVACIAWTVTHEEVLQEVRQYFIVRKQTSRRLYQRKFFYVFTCEYCFSHYVAALFVGLTGFKLIVPNWAGTVIAFFALVWVSNHYMTLYGILRLNMQGKRLQKEVSDQPADPAALRQLRPVNPGGTKPG